MFRQIIYFLSIIHVVLAFSGCIEYERYYGSKEWEFKNENGSWSKNIPQEVGNYQFRCTINIAEPCSSEPLALSVGMLASSEVYWDNKLLGRNGKVADSKEFEIPGKMFSAFIIPDSLCSTGEHQVLIKLSNFNAGNNPRFYGIFITNYSEIIRNPLITTLYIHIYAGCFLIIGLFFLVRYFMDRMTISHLLFSLCCLLFFALLYMEYLRNHYDYPYDWHFVRLKIILGLSTGIGLLLPLYFMFRFSFPRKLLVIGFLVITYTWFILQVENGYDWSSSLIMIEGFLVSSILCGYAVYDKKKGSMLALIGIGPLAFLILAFQTHYDLILYVGFGNLILLLMISLAINERALKQERELALIRSTRLEIELLKKNIQPHFLLNSITSAIDWIEQKPEKGVEFLFTLVKEFDILLDISNKKLIPINQEIELCQAHLKIMEFRKLQSYKLNVQNNDPTLHIPPAIILTLLENAISHGLGDQIDFHLKVTSNQNELIISFLSNDSQIVSKKVNDEGTGTKYIKARLEESYPGSWTFFSGYTTTGWISTITITKSK